MIKLLYPENRPILETEVKEWVQSLYNDGKTSVDPSKGKTSLMDCILALEGLKLAKFASFKD